MSPQSKLKPEEKKLVRRYLIWCYKTTKEELDRVDRYFTQVRVDRYMLSLVQKAKVKNEKVKHQYNMKVEEFKRYIESKEKRATFQKFLDIRKKSCQPNYIYLRNRLTAIEKAIKKFLGMKELKTIRNLYEEEMTTRILQAREHT